LPHSRQHAVSITACPVATSCCISDEPCQWYIGTVYEGVTNYNTFLPVTRFWNNQSISMKVHCRRQLTTQTTDCALTVHNKLIPYNTLPIHCRRQFADIKRVDVFS